MCSVSFMSMLLRFRQLLDLNELYQLKKPQFPSLDAVYLRNT